MIAVGIDISKAKSTVAVIDSDGTVLASPFTMAHTQPEMEAFVTYVYDVDYKFLHDYSVELSRISNLLNQIAKRANTTGNLYSEDIKEVKELMQKVWHTHESMLSKQPLISR